MLHISISFMLEKPCFIIFITQTDKQFKLSRETMTDLWNHRTKEAISLEFILCSPLSILFLVKILTLIMLNVIMLPIPRVMRSVFRLVSLSLSLSFGPLSVHDKSSNTGHFTLRGQVRSWGLKMCKMSLYKKEHGISASNTHSLTTNIALAFHRWSKRIKWESHKESVIKPADITSNCNIFTITP